MGRLVLIPSVFRKPPEGISGKQRSTWIDEFISWDGQVARFRQAATRIFAPVKMLLLVKPSERKYARDSGADH